MNYAAKIPSVRSKYLVATALLVSVSPLSIAAAQAQTAQAAAADVDEIVVTATRVVRDGYQAPTPTSVLAVEQIEQAAQFNISDFVNQLPQVAGSATTRTGNGGSSGGTGGISALNLRGLGSNRTLVLLDGHRVVGASFNGAPDVGQFPQALVSRVDVVTGGASAAWGSDAVSGVVNFILDRDYQGVKGEVNGGITTYGDDAMAKVTLTTGTSFAGGRGHFLLSGEYGYNEGVKYATERPWYEAWKIIAYPLAATPAGQPQFLVRPNVGLSSSTPGGIIMSGPLKGIIFGPNGEPRNYNYGNLTLGGLTQGGDWEHSDIGYFSWLDNRIAKQTIFARSSYDLTDTINAWGELSWGNVHTNYICCGEFNRNFTIRRDNPYLPGAVGTAMDGAGLTNIAVGSWLGDIGPVTVDNTRRQTRAAFGVDGKFGDGWSWNAYYTHGWNKIDNLSGNQTITARTVLAADAVRAPSGAIVCRSTLTDPGNGCVPMNVMGTGVISDSAKKYVLGQPELHTMQIQRVAAVSVQGEPFELWAGPVSIAFGAEYRKESARGANDGPISTGNGYFSGNFKATQGMYHDYEGFIETVVPLAIDETWARSLELNAAVRATDYSLAGYVTTWKVGLSYQPVDDLRLRATRSRDIRAPNLSELFLAGQTNTQTVTDLFPPFAGTVFTVRRNTFGNVNLRPEIAQTFGLGAVLTPSFIPRFAASFDYYKIDLGGAIATPANQVIMDYCFQGVTELCQYIVRNAAGQITDINGLPVNIASQINKGFDIETSYTLPLDEVVSDWNGEFALRVLATHVISNKQDQFGIITENAGQNTGSSAKWRWFITANYENGPVNFNMGVRILSSGVYNNDYVECASGCPAPTALHPTIDNNQIPGATYFDFGLNYRVIESDSGSVDAFARVENAFNVDPAVVAAGGNLNFINAGTNPTLYDTVGRMFKVGVRFKM